MNPQSQWRNPDASQECVSAHAYSVLISRGRDAYIVVCSQGLIEEAEPQSRLRRNTPVAPKSHPADLPCPELSSGFSNFWVSEVNLIARQIYLVWSLIRLRAVIMESLSDETWDVVIVGTSIPQSLLAL